MSVVTELRCARCEETKPVTAFPLKLSNKSGRRGVCFTCEPPKPSPPPKPVLSPAAVAAMCGKKKRYSSQGLALQVATRAARREVLIRVYPCPLCGGFHLTHQPPRRPR